MFNKVLETKRGNPIGLCCVYLLVAERLKLPIYGVNFPNLFLLTYKKNGQQFYINAFNRGLILSRADIENYLVGLKIQANESFFQPCENIEIIRRILRNLHTSFENQEKTEQKEEVFALLNLLEDEA